MGADAVTSLAHEFGQTSGSDVVTTQFASGESTAKLVVQNGRAQGNLQSIEITKDGTIKGKFSNGTSRSLYKIPLATFPNEEGLSRVGSNLYSESAGSGSAQVGNANEGGKGEIRSFSIEQSNVDLATEFVRVITYQRAFQASARTVSTSASLLEDLVQLGR